MKKTLLAFLLCLALVALPACGDDHWFEARYSNYDLSDYVELPAYSAISLNTAKVDELVQNRVTELLSEIGVTYYESGVLKQGDIVVMNYVGVLEGATEPFDGGSATDAELVLGAGDFIDGFEDGLIGKNAGEEIVLTLTFPDDYGVEELNGKGVTFTVKVTGYFRQETPTELTDLLINRHTRGAYPTVDAFMTETRSYYTENTAFAQLLELAIIKEYPQVELNARYEELANQIYNTYLTGGARNQGLDTFEAYLASELFLFNYGNSYYNGMTFSSVASFEEATMTRAKAEMRHDLVLSAVAQKENIRIDWDTYVAEANKLARDYPYYLESYEDLERDIMTRSEIYHAILFEAVYDFLGTAIVA